MSLIFTREASGSSHHGHIYNSILNASFWILLSICWFTYKLCSIFILSGQENAKNDTSRYTVLPTRKKAPEPERVLAETKKLKPKKNNLKKKWKSKKRFFLKKQGHQDNVARDDATGCNGTEALQTGDVAMLEVMKFDREEFRKSSFDENQVGANCEFNAGLDQIRAVPDGENWCMGSNVMESA